MSWQKMMESGATSPVESVYGVGPEQGQLLRRRGVSTMGTLVSEYRSRGPEGFKTWMKEAGVSVEGSRLTRVTNALEAYCHRKNLSVLSGELVGLGDKPQEKRTSAHVPSSPQRSHAQEKTPTPSGHDCAPHVVVTVNRVLTYPTRCYSQPPQLRDRENVTAYVPPRLGLVHTDVVITYIGE